MTDSHFFPLAALQHNLKRLLLIRAIVLGFQVLALSYAFFVLGLSLPYLPLGSVLLGYILFNAALALHLRRRAVSQRAFLGHLLMDVAVLSVLLYFSGGAGNPFVSYYLVPLTVSAATLSWGYTWTVAGASIACYSLLLFVYQPLPELTMAGMHPPGHIPGLHILGMWLNFLVSAVLITSFVVKMAREIRQREEALVRYREDNLRDEQIIALATQAAGTAHELGTPLSTMAVLLKDMQRDTEADDPLHKDIALLRRQVAHCKDILRDLARQADFRHRAALPPEPLDVFIRRILDQWQLLRPETGLRLALPPGAAPPVKTDPILQQAIVNLLNNAADASPERIEVMVDWRGEHWRMRVRDFGPGIGREIAEQLGTRVVSTKEAGLGMGVMLSQASINRAGGEVSTHPHAEGGTLTEIRLPLARPAGAPSNAE